MSERKDDSPHEGPGVLVEVSRVVELLFSVGLLALVRFVPPAAEEEWVNRVNFAFFFFSSAKRNPFEKTENEGS